ncbi:MAG: glycosyltransferase [Actinomycetota bacterium]|nr:glycosyltransferase [Actinomycetota bacterium]
MSADFLLAVLNTVAFLLCVSFLAYVMLIMVPFLRYRPGLSGDPRAHDWHLLVPCRNEEEVIAETISGLRRTFPAAHIWCIDDASTDGTGAILASLRRRHARLHVVTRRPPDAAKGKGPALNAGWQAVVASLPPGVDLERVVVGVLDADARLDPDAAAVISGPAWFGNPSVGAVQIQVRVSATTLGPRLPAARRLLVRLQDLEFSGPIAAMQMLRRRSGSVGMGGNGQFTRLSVLNLIATGAGTPWHGALLEDFELGLHVLLAGSRTEYCHDTWVSQDGLAHVRTLLRQRSRWAQGSMQCFTYLQAILRSSNISTMGAVELTYFLLLPWLQLFGSVIYAAAFSVLGYYAFAEPGGLSAWWNAGAWGILPLFVLFGIAPFLVWGFIYRRYSDPSLRLPTAFALGMANWAYGYLQQTASWWAFVRVARNRHDWKKTAHTRPDDGPVTVAAGSPALAGVFAPVRHPQPPTPSPTAPTRRPIRPMATARFVAGPSLSPQSPVSHLPTSPAPAGTSSQPNHGRIPALSSSEAS